MQILIVKNLVESYDVDQLTLTEEALLEEKQLPFEIEGEDDAEVLAHITAAVWIIEKMESHDLSLDKALEEYTEKSRRTDD